MSYQLIKTRDNEHWAKLNGKLTVREFQELQALGKLSLEQFGQFRIYGAGMPKTIFRKNSDSLLLTRVPIPFPK